MLKTPTMPLTRTTQRYRHHFISSHLSNTLDLYTYTYRLDSGD